MPRPPFQVLILCTGNSARSIIGEYLLRERGKGRFEVVSAGARPSGCVHPLSLWVLQRHFDIDASDARSKSWEEFEGRRFDFVITVCDNAREACPVFPGQPVTAHWGSPDPAAFEGNEGEQKQFFLRVATQIERRVELFCSFPDDKLDALTVRGIGEQHRMDDEASHAR